MKTIVNTAWTDFIADGTKKSAVSNSCRLHLLTHDCFLQGQVVCTSNCRRWNISIVQKSTDSVVFSLSGRKGKGFCFEPDISFEYKLIFTADQNSTLRLYNTPECITDIMYCDNQ